jgi:hypothetical protein
MQSTCKYGILTRQQIFLNYSTSVWIYFTVLSGVPSSGHIFNEQNFLEINLKINNKKITIPPFHYLPPCREYSH